ncbi:ABC transporter substrate-binding protein [Bacillus sp. FJAT-44742]|uniref:ABC transporter substrate-binding protein n=1 Tax=Bacillus sp. FJAT-44742 TaxID=2014005 RepID=UPI000C240C2A|nr:sugar ABC transporter substrate-binding protein [Bacillus sp. FJAT-44742]
MREKSTLLISLLFLCLLTACTENTGTSEAGDNQEEKPQGSIDLDIWVMGADDYWRSYHDDLANRFEEKHNNITINIDYIPWDEGENKLVTTAANDRLPDITTVAGRWTPQLAAMGAFEPLDQFIDTDFKESFVEAPWETTQYEDQTWGLPVGFTTTGLFYRSDWLEEQGFTSPPETWEEFVEVAKSFTTDNQYGFGLVGYNGMETTMFWAPFLWSNGGDFLTEDLQQAAFNSNEGVEALEFYTDLLRKHSVAPEGSVNNDRTDSRDLFITETVGMTTQGPWLPKFIEEGAPELEYEIAPYPVKKEAVNLGTVDHIAMTKQATHKEESWKFIEFFTNKENDMKWAQHQGFIPYHKENLDRDDRRNTKEFEVFFEVAPDAKAYPTIPEWPQIDQAIAEAIQETLMGVKSPQEALDEAADEVNQLLSK